MTQEISNLEGLKNNNNFERNTIDSKRESFFGENFIEEQMDIFIETILEERIEIKNIKDLRKTMEEYLQKLLDETPKDKQKEMRKKGKEYLRIFFTEINYFSKATEAEQFLAKLHKNQITEIIESLIKDLIKDILVEKSGVKIDSENFAEKADILYRATNDAELEQHKKEILRKLKVDYIFKQEFLINLEEKVKTLGIDRKKVFYLNVLNDYFIKSRRSESTLKIQGDSEKLPEKAKELILEIANKIDNNLKIEKENSEESALTGESLPLRIQGGLGNFLVSLLKMREASDSDDAYCIDVALAELLVNKGYFNNLTEKELEILWSGFCIARADNRIRNSMLSYCLEYFDRIEGIAEWFLVKRRDMTLPEFLGRNSSENVNLGVMQVFENFGEKELAEVAFFVLDLKTTIKRKGVKANQRYSGFFHLIKLIDIIENFLKREIYESLQGNFNFEEFITEVSRIQNNIDDLNRDANEKFVLGNVLSRGRNKEFDADIGRKFFKNLLPEKISIPGYRSKVTKKYKEIIDKNI